jgi:cytochrome c-type biogenesis protein CcmH/NrfF
MTASNFREAVLAKILSEVRCPECGAENIAGRKPTIDVDLEAETCSCNQCGHGGALKTFNPTVRETT